MNVDTMRKIDYYAGVPLCFLGTLLTKVCNAITPKKKDEVKNVLFIELSEMGSAILVDPAMQKLKNTHGANLHFVIFKSNKMSLDLLKSIDNENIYTISSDGLIPLVVDTLKFFLWTRKKGIDTVIDLELFSRFTALLSGFSGAKKIVGFHAFHNEGLYRGDFLTHKVSYNPHIHIAKNFIALVDSLFVDVEIPYTKRAISDDEIELRKVNIKDEDKTSVFQSIKRVYSEFDNNPIVLINSNASDLLPQRRWNRENFAKLIEMMLEVDDNTIYLLTGSPDEREWVGELESMVRSGRCINFAGEVKFLELPILYYIRNFLDTNDSGPAHFASITNMHTFVIFGPETPKLYGSLGSSTPIYANLACSPCVSASNHRKTPCNDNVCIQVITPESVFNTVKPMLRDA